jgi:ribonuclease-3
MAEYSSEDSRIAEFESRINYQFRNRELAYVALTHASGADDRLHSNERLEFLGDAVLGLIVCEILYQRFPQLTEGELTRLKSVVVSRASCASVARSLGLADFLIVGKGLASQAALPSSLLAAAVEAVIAAVYLDGGLSAVQRFIEPLLIPRIEAVAEDRVGENYKSLLQQVSQKTWGATPVYILLDQQGPDHSKYFKVAAQVGGTRYRPAWGRSKKEAEQRAACNAIYELNHLPPPCSDQLGPVDEDGHVNFAFPPQNQNLCESVDQ